MQWIVTCDVLKRIVTSDVMERTVTGDVNETVAVNVVKQIQDQMSSTVYSTLIAGGSSTEIETKADLNYT